MRRSLPFWLLVVLTVGMAGCDQATKEAARRRLEGQDHLTVVGGLLDLRYRENKGVSFSLLGDLPERVRRPLLVAIPLVAAPLMAWFLWRQRRQGWPVSLGAAMMLGGTVGNLGDRLLRGGRVADFIHLHHWAVFNLADVWLVIGVGLLLLFGRRRLEA